MTHRLHNPRDKEICRLFVEGKTQQEIGDIYHLTRERVRQILKYHGLTGPCGGQALKTAIKKQTFEDRRNERCLKTHGMDFETYQKYKNSPYRKAYTNQRKSASNRKIEFTLTFGQWIHVWEASGRLEQRGIGLGSFCMSRYRDQGGYELGNVYINRTEDNSRDALTRPKSKKLAPGIFMLYPGLQKPWCAKYGRKVIGYFETEEQAAKAKVEFIERSGIEIKGRGYAIINKNGRPYRYQVLVGRKYVGSYKSAEEALDARRKYLEYKGEKK